MTKTTETENEFKGSIIELLSFMQRELKVPKDQLNKFGGYKFRNCEDILEGIKKILPSNAAILLNDEMAMIGDRFYIKATAKLALNDQTLDAVAYAREPLAKKGFDESQITGAASSYARKYALNGLFAIDDTKDADSHDNTEKKTEEKPKSKTANINVDRVNKAADYFRKAVTSESADTKEMKRALDSLTPQERVALMGQLNEPIGDTNQTYQAKLNNIVK